MKITNKKCIKCGCELILNHNFREYNLKKYYHICKTCNNSLVKEYYKKNKDKFNILRKTYYIKNKEKINKRTKEYSRKQTELFNKEVSIEERTKIKQSINTDELYKKVMEKLK